MCRNSGDAGVQVRGVFLICGGISRMMQVIEQFERDRLQEVTELNVERHWV